VVPSDLTWNTAIPAWVAFEHTLLELKITYAKAPEGVITIEDGEPFKRQVWLLVSLVELATDPICPEPGLRLKVWMTDDPWLPTSTNPLVDEL
jgi:hypothetical protein